MTKEAIVYIEICDNKILDVTKEIISKANCSFDGVEVNGIVIANSKTLDVCMPELQSLSLHKIYALTDDILDNYSTCIYSQVLANFLEEKNPDIFLMGATTNGRDLAPRTASKLNIGLTADCTDLQLDDAGSLLATRPTYGGKMMATILSKTKPNFATIRAGAFKNKPSLKYSVPQIVYIQQNMDGVNCLLTILNCEIKPKLENWTCSEVIIAGGLGLKSKENFELIYELAKLCDGKPAATRAAIEQGWAPQEIQVGQTGASVSPKLYIAFGISGAMQHLVGVTNSDVVIAINTDKFAPIMKFADFAIVADAESVLKSMISSLQD